MAFLAMVLHHFEFVLFSFHFLGEPLPFLSLRAFLSFSFSWLSVLFHIHLKTIGILHKVVMSSEGTVYLFIFIVVFTFVFVFPFCTSKEKVPQSHSQPTDTGKTISKAERGSRQGRDRNGRQGIAGEGRPRERSRRQEGREERTGGGEKPEVIRLRLLILVEPTP